MAKIIIYPISCSSEGELDARKLYVWGEWDKAKWLPLTKGEAQRRIELCRKENKCKTCDAQVHRVEIQRTKKTYKQMMTESVKNNKNE